MEKFRAPDFPPSLRNAFAPRLYLMGAIRMTLSEWQKEILLIIFVGSEK